MYILPDNNYFYRKQLENTIYRGPVAAIALYLQRSSRMLYRGWYCDAMYIAPLCIGLPFCDLISHRFHHLHCCRYNITRKKTSRVITDKLTVLVAGAGRGKERKEWWKQRGGDGMVERALWLSGGSILTGGDERC